MLIHGDFINHKGDRISVRIVTKKDETEALEIGDGKSGLFFTDEPAEIEDESNDLFDALLTQSARVRLLAETFVPDFFQLSARDAEVTITRNGSEVLYSGYIEPQTYSQDYNSVLDEVELNCIDRLSALQYVSYGGVRNSETYATAKAAAEQRTFADIIIGMLGGGVYFDASKSLNAERPYTLLSDISINELLFFGDDEESVWTEQEALEAILRYLDLHIRQAGDRFYIFSWSSVQTAGGVTFRDISDPENDEAAVTLTVTETTITNAMAEDCDTSITVGEAFNQIKLTCERTECEELAISPLEEDSLVAPFPKRSLYAREYVVKYDDVDGDERWAWRIQAAIDGAGGLDIVKAYNYYIQVLRNSQWLFKPIINGAPAERDAYDIYTSGAHTLLDKTNVFPLGYTEANYYAASFVPCIVKIWKSSNLAELPNGINGDPAEIKDETYMVIPVRGTGRALGKGDSNAISGTYFPHYLKMMQDMGGLVQCKSAVGGGTLSPADEETTNYIVISGKLTLMQPANIEGRPIDTYGTGKFDCSYVLGDERTVRSKMDGWEERWRGLKKYKWDIEKRNNDDSGGGESGYNSWDCKDGGDTVFRVMGWFGEDGSLAYPAVADDSGSPCFAPPIGGWTHLEFSYNSDHDEYDSIDKVAVLDCQIKVGDKYCVETFEDYTAADGRTRTRSVMKWYTYDECPRYSVEDEDGVTREYVKTTFSVGINPGIGDHIIGQEYDINNTVPTLAAIDAEGVALPVKASDRLSGRVEFSIIGPVNGTWLTVYRRHPTLFRRTKWTDASYSVLDYCSAVFIKDFKIEAYSDNGGLSVSGDESDLVYISDEETAYKNVKEPDAFKINTALTSAECAALGISNAVCLSCPSDATTNTALRSIYDPKSGETAKPEQMYVDAYYNALRAPKVLMEQNTRDTAADPRDTFGVYKHQAMNGKEFMVRGYSRDLMDGSVKLNLQEI